MEYNCRMLKDYTRRMNDCIEELNKDMNDLEQEIYDLKYEVTLLRSIIGLGSSDTKAVLFRYEHGFLERETRFILERALKENGFTLKD